jgi:hypothetical protein
VQYHNLKGWLLRAVADLDAVAPGVAGHVIRSSDERRHVIAALLSVTPGTSFDEDFGRFILIASHDDLIHAAFNFVPVGYRGALARSGVHTQPRKFYRYLAGLLSSPRRSDMARVVRRLQRITWPRLKVMRALAADLRHPSFVDLVKDQQQARDVTSSVHLLAARGADRGEMRRALAAVKSPPAIAAFARRWALKTLLPEHPVPATTSYIPISTGDQLRSIAKRYRNCSRSHIVRVHEGRSAFAEVVSDRGNAVVHLVRGNAGWALDDVYSVDNEPAPREIETTVLRYLAQFGIKPVAPVQVESAWAPLRRILGAFEFEY